MKKTSKDGLGCWLFWGPLVVTQEVSERRHLSVAAPTWFIARAVAMRELGCSAGELVELGVEATDVTPHMTVTWAGSAASSHNTLRLVETRNAR